MYGACCELVLCPAGCWKLQLQLCVMAESFGVQSNAANAHLPLSLTSAVASPK